MVACPASKCERDPRIGRQKVPIAGATARETRGFPLMKTHSSRCRQSHFVLVHALQVLKTRGF